MTDQAGRLSGRFGELAPVTYNAGRKQLVYRIPPMPTNLRPQHVDCWFGYAGMGQLPASIPVGVGG